MCKKTPGNTGVHLSTREEANSEKSEDDADARSQVEKFPSPVCRDVFLGEEDEYPESLHPHHGAAEKERATYKCNGKGFPDSAMRYPIGDNGLKAYMIPPLVILGKMADEVDVGVH